MKKWTRRFLCASVLLFAIVGCDPIAPTRTSNNPPKKFEGLKGVNLEVSGTEAESKQVFSRNLLALTVPDSLQASWVGEELAPYTYAAFHVKQYGNNVFVTAFAKRDTLSIPTLYVLNLDRPQAFACTAISIEYDDLGRVKGASAFIPSGDECLEAKIGFRY